MAYVTLLGASGSTIAVTLDGAKATALAQQFVKDVKAFADNGNPAPMEVGDRLPYNPNHLPLEGIIRRGGIDSVTGNTREYKVGDEFRYLAVGGYNDTKTFDKNNPIVLHEPVKIISTATDKNHVIDILAGSTELITYVAGKENGKFIGGSGPIKFEGNTVDGGNWNIVTGDADDTITAGNGQNTIDAGAGRNVITLSTGYNDIASEGADSISGPGYNSITLMGGSSSNYHAVINMGERTLVNDVSAYNTITVGGGSTVIGGTNSTVLFDSTKGASDANDPANSFIGGVNDTITANVDKLIVSRGYNNQITTSGQLTFLNGFGNTTITAANSTIFGADNLNLHVNTVDGGTSDPLLFVGSQGNETLDGSTYSKNMHVFANTVLGGTSSLIAQGGAGDDTLVGGTGNDTFTGSKGNNLFAFIKETGNGGKTVITDFSASSGNKIGLYNYGLDADSLQAMLEKATEENGNTTLNISNHTIVLQGVSVNSLNANSFDIINSPTTPQCK